MLKNSQSRKFYKMIWKDKNKGLILNIKHVLSCFDCLENTPIGMKLWGLNTTFSAIFTKGNNFCDFLFALTQLAG